MTLATILAVFCLACGWSPVLSSTPAATAIQTSTSSPQAQTPSQTSPPASTSPATSPAAPSSAKPAQRHRKKAPKQDCGNSVASSTTSSSGNQKPCPPKKIVVRNGGTSQPTVELKGTTSEEQASSQRSTEQLTAATEENLGKIGDQPLDPSKQELVNQIRQFMEQSKTAIAAGDPDRGHNLAIKAHLLSEELVKP